MTSRPPESSRRGVRAPGGAARAEVDADGTHESLIGVGYILGPALGLGVSAATEIRWFPQSLSFGVTLVGVVLAVCVVVGVWTAWWVRGQIAVVDSLQTDD